MGQIDILIFLKDYPLDWFKISELASELHISERNIRRAVVNLEGAGLIVGRCRGNYRNWNREFKIKND